MNIISNESIAATLFEQSVQITFQPPLQLYVNSQGRHSQIGRFPLLRAKRHHHCMQSNEE